MMCNHSISYILLVLRTGITAKHALLLLCATAWSWLYLNLLHTHIFTKFAECVTAHTLLQSAAAHPTYMHLNVDDIQ